MKVRNGFVSNSSSSSFIMLIPESFNVDEFDFTPHQNSLRINNTDEETMKRTFKKLQSEKSLWGDDGDNYYALTEIFNDFVIGQVETGPDEGGVSILSKREIEKIKKLLA